MVEPPPIQEDVVVLPRSMRSSFVFLFLRKSTSTSPTLFFFELQSATRHDTLRYTSTLPRHREERNLYSGRRRRR